MTAELQATRPQPQNDQVRAVEQFLLQLPQTDLQHTHHIVRTPLGVMYARQIVVPADTVITGAACKVDHLCTVQGDITVSTDSGVRRITGQDTFTARAGHKRIGIAHSNTVWTTYQIVQSDDLEQIERELTDEADMLLTRRGLLPFDINRALEG